MAQTYEGGREIHPGAGIAGKEIHGEWTRPGRKVRFGPCRDGWWAQSGTSIGDWPWQFETREDVERAVEAMLNAYPRDEWTRTV